MHNVLVGFVFFDHNDDGALRKDRMFMMRCVVCEPHTHGEREREQVCVFVCVCVYRCPSWKTKDSCLNGLGLLLQPSRSSRRWQRIGFLLSVCRG